MEKGWSRFVFFEIRVRCVGWIVVNRVKWEDFKFHIILDPYSAVDSNSSVPPIFCTILSKKNFESDSYNIQIFA
jgi:hypothetical protein